MTEGTLEIYEISCPNGMGWAKVLASDYESAVCKYMDDPNLDPGIEFEDDEGRYCLLAVLCPDGRRHIVLI